ncbi:MAG: hypothetical protein ACRCVA_35755 [Phreatobacter sp.]
MSFSKTATFAAAALALAGSLSGAAQARDGYQRWFDVVNTSRTTPIYSVFATNRDDRSFGRDLLGDSMVAPGASMRVAPDIHRGYCIFDVRVRYENGRELTRWGVNLCEATALIVSPNGSIGVR